MWQSILQAPRTSALEQRPKPKPTAHEALIRVELCGVCASELHPWLHADSETEFGHEVVGEIVDMGSQVEGLDIGMRVTGLIHKGFAEYALADASLLIEVPTSLGSEEAIGEPLSCVISGMRRSDIDLGDELAIVGLGYMGLLSLQVARLKGPSNIIAIDTRTEALALAARYGADICLHPQDVPEHYLLERWQDIPKGTGLDAVIEAAGQEAALGLATRLLKAHGFLAIVGYHQGANRRIDMQMWNWKALDVLNAHERRQDYQMDCMRRGLKLVEAKKIDAAPLISHRFSLEHVDKAYSAILEKPEGFIKAIVEV